MGERWHTAPMWDQSVMWFSATQRILKWQLTGRVKRTLRLEMWGLGVSSVAKVFVCLAITRTWVQCPGTYFKMSGYGVYACNPSKRISGASWLTPLSAPGQWETLSCGLCLQPPHTQSTKVHMQAHTHTQTQKVSLNWGFLFKNNKTFQ